MKVCESEPGGFFSLSAPQKGEKNKIFHIPPCEPKYK